MEKVLKRLGVELPEYCETLDPTKQTDCGIDWNIYPSQIKEIDDRQKQMVKDAKKHKNVSSFDADKEISKKRKKDEIKEE